MKYINVARGAGSQIVLLCYNIRNIVTCSAGLDCIPKTPGGGGIRPEAGPGVSSQKFIFIFLFFAPD